MNKIVLFLTLVLLISCDSKSKSKTNTSENIDIGKLNIMVVNYPLYYFSQRIGGEYVTLDYNIPIDIDPAYWVPNEKELTQFQSADLIFLNGAGYAKWLNNVSLPSSRMINTSYSVKENYIETTEKTSHSHGPGGTHEHAGFSFTTWLDFEIATVQAGTIKEQLVKKLPQYSAEIEKNYSSLERDLGSIDKRMNLVSKAINEQGISFIGSHPVYQYLAKAYSLNIHSVHFEPNEVPSQEQWRSFDHTLEKYPSRIILWEDEPLSEVRLILKNRGLETLVFSPCANKPETLDFIEMMNQNITALESVLNINK